MSPSSTQGSQRATGVHDHAPGAQNVDAAHTPALNRRDRRKLELTQRILHAGEALFEDQGYDETKVSEICERADVAYGTFFNHFPNKRDILSAMADRSVREIGEHLESLAGEPGSIEDHLIQLFEGEAQQIQKLTPLSRDLLGRVQALAFTDAPEDRDRRFHAAFEAFLRRSVEAGRVRDDVPIETLADVVSSTFASMSLSWVHFDDSPVRERAAEAARFLASILAPQWAPRKATGLIPPKAPRKITLKATLKATPKARRRRT